MLPVQKLSFNPRGGFEPAAEAGVSLATHWAKEKRDEMRILDRAVLGSDDPALYSLLPTGDTHSLRGSEYKLTAMPYRPYAEVSKTTVIPIVVAQDETGRKRTYMLLDQMPAMDDKSVRTVKLLETCSTYSCQADGKIAYETHSYQALSLLLGRKIDIKDVSCDMDYTLIEQEEMRAQATLTGVFCRAHLTRVVEYRVEDDSRCNRNVVYTAVITPAKGFFLRKEDLAREFKVVDCGDEIGRASSVEKAKSVADSFLSRMPSNYLRFSQQALVMCRVFSRLHKEMPLSTSGYRSRIACVFVIGLASLIWYMRRSS